MRMMMKGSFVAMCGLALGLSAIAGCASKKVTAHMYQVRGDGDRTFINTVLDLEKRQNGIDSTVQETGDKVVTVTTSENAHLKLRRELNVRVSDQWPYNWRTDDF